MALNIVFKDKCKNFVDETFYNDTCEDILLTFSVQDSILMENTSGFLYCHWKLCKHSEVLDYPLQQGKISEFFECFPTVQ